MLSIIPRLKSWAEFKDFKQLNSNGQLEEFNLNHFGVCFSKEGFFHNTLI